MIEITIPGLIMFGLLVMIVGVVVGQLSVWKKLRTKRKMKLNGWVYSAEPDLWPEKGGME